MPEDTDKAIAPVKPKVIGSICANDHPRISHHELACPMCHVINAFVMCAEHNERLIDEAHYRQAELENALDQLNFLKQDPSLGQLLDVRQNLDGRKS